MKDAIVNMCSVSFSSNPPPPPFIMPHLPYVRAYPTLFPSPMSNPLFLPPPLPLP